MRARSVLFSLVAVIGIAAMAPASVRSAPAALLGPAYDASTAASVRNLVVAMHSALLFDDEAPVATAEDLAEWGWTPGEHLAVEIWVAGDDFRVEAQDVRPGASRFAYSSTTAASPGVAGSGAVARVDGSRSEPRPDAPGVILTRVAALPPTPSV